MIEPKTIFENLFFTTVRIETVCNDNSISTGTGFMMSYDLENGNNNLYLVTNKHVIENGYKMEFLF